MTKHTKEAKPQEESHSEQQAKAQLESIREYVAALECDYERLAELREQRGHAVGALIGKAVNPTTAWNDANPASAAELKELEEAAGECESEDDARERIQEDALSVQVRYGWIDPGATDDMIASGPEEFEILLCTGGPACRIIGQLGQHNEPERPRLQHQDWGTSWQEYIPAAGSDALLTYCRQFYFGD